MYLHTCQKCLHSFRRKDYLTKHLQRKYPCKEANNNNIVEQGKSKVSPSIDFGKSKVSPLINIENVENIENIETNLKSNEEYNTKKYECEYCNKDYYHKQSKFKHLKNCEKYKKITEQQPNKIQITAKLQKKLINLIKL